MKLLGVDFGSRKIGLAIGDTDSKLALPFGVVASNGQSIEELIVLAGREGVDGFVVGVPIPSDFNQRQTQLERVSAFARDLKAASGLLVYLVDEAFTSTEARRIQEEEAVAAKEDEIAACLILQEYFDNSNF